MLWVFDGLLDFLKQRLENSQSVPIRRQMRICASIEAVLVQPLLNTGLSQERFGRPCQKIRFEELEILAAEEHELGIHIGYEETWLLLFQAMA